MATWILVDNDPKLHIHKFNDLPYLAQFKVMIKNGVESRATEIVFRQAECLHFRWLG